MIVVKLGNVLLLLLLLLFRLDRATVSSLWIPSPSTPTSASLLEVVLLIVLLLLLLLLSVTEAVISFEIRWMLVNFDCCAMWFKDREYTINALRSVNNMTLATSERRCYSLIMT